MKRRLTLALLAALVLSAGAAWGQPTATVLYKEQIDTESELQSLVTDVTDFITNNDSAGGDLAGSYPNPTIANDAVGATELENTASLTGDHALAANEMKFGASGLIWEGATADTIETYFSVVDPTTSDRTVTIPNADTATAQAVTCSGNDKVSGFNATTGAFTCTTDQDSGGTPAWEALVNTADTATAYTSNNTAETVTFSFESAFGASQQFLIRQQTGNPTAGTLLDVRAADANVTVFRAGDGTNGITVSQAGALTAEGTGTIVATSGDSATSFFSSGEIADAQISDTITASNYLLLSGGTMTGDITLTERSSDISDPSEGNWVCWMSDGTGSGADGDVLCKITAAATTKFFTLADFSAI